MKILLINPPVFLNGRQVLVDSQEPYTLMSLAALLKGNGYEVELIDYLVERYAPSALKERLLGREIAGLSVSSRVLNSALTLAREIKSRYGLFIIAGGPHATIAPQDLLKDGLIDIAVRGEGEETLLELLMAREKGENDFRRIKGVAFSSGGKISCVSKLKH